MDGTRRGRKTYLVRDIAERFGEYSDAPIGDRELLIRAVFDTLRDILKEAKDEDKVVISGFGTWSIKRVPQSNGKLRNFHTNEIMAGGGGLRVKWTPSVKIKKHLKNQYD